MHRPPQKFGTNHNRLHASGDFSKTSPNSSVSTESNSICSPKESDSICSPNESDSICSLSTIELESISCPSSPPVSAIKKALEAGTLTAACPNLVLKKDKRIPLSPQLISQFQTVETTPSASKACGQAFSSIEKLTESSLVKSADIADNTKSSPNNTLGFNSIQNDGSIDKIGYETPENQSDTQISIPKALSQVSLNTQILNYYTAIEHVPETKRIEAEPPSNLSDEDIINSTEPIEAHFIDHHNSACESLSFSDYEANLDEDSENSTEDHPDLGNAHDIEKISQTDKDLLNPFSSAGENYSQHICSSQSLTEESTEELSVDTSEISSSDSLLSSESGDEKKQDELSEILYEHPPIETTSQNSPQALGIDESSENYCNFMNSFKNIPMLSIELKEDIEKFSIEGYASQYFAVRSKALNFFSAKKVIPLNTLMSWSKAPLTHPLTELAKKFHKDALRAFKDVQRIMGERSGASSFGQTCAPVSEVQNLITLAINNGELRDELLCQVIKQTTMNPNLVNTRRGWSLLGALCATIPPSKNLQSYLVGFLMKSILESKAKVAELQVFLASSTPLGSSSKKSKNVQQEELIHRTAIYRASKFALKGIRRTCMPGVSPRLRIPLAEEIEHLMNMSLYDSPFGESLEQKDVEVKGPDSPTTNEQPACIPKIAMYLTEAIISLGGLSTPGIFRIAGNNEQLSILRRSLEKGEFRTLYSDAQSPKTQKAKSSSPKRKSNSSLCDSGTPLPVNDVHVPATLLKTWLRELEVSLVPEHFYDAALKAANISSQSEKIAAIKKIVSALPPCHKSTLEFLTLFFRIIAGEDQGPNETKMNVTNLAIVFGPTILRAPASVSSDSAMDIAKAFNNAKLEQLFLTTILSNPTAIFS
ncbi:hypothetical protein MDAP_000613 [Mitosporidium daphniae]